MIDWLQKSLILRFSKLDCLIFYTYDIVSDVVEILVQWGVRILANCASTSTTSETVLYMLLSHKLEKCQINKNACCFLLPCQILYYINITQRKCIGIWPWTVLPSRICRNIDWLDKYSIRSQDPDNSFDSETSFLVSL